MALTVTGSEFHVEGPADYATAFQTDSVAYVTAFWQGKFDGQLKWTNTGAAASFRVLCTYATEGEDIDGKLKITPDVSTGAELDLAPTTAANKLSGEDWAVAGGSTSLTIAADETVQFELKAVTNPGAVYVRSIDLVRV